MITKETKKHTKHTDLTKPYGGEYHRNEWAIIGAPCDIIKDLAKQIHEGLEKVLKIGFLDADHKKGRRKQKFHSSVTDKIGFLSIETKRPFLQKQNRNIFRSLDVLLVNGNHFNGDKQIVIIHEDKKESLSRKLDRLTDIRAILLMKDSDEIYDFVIDKIDQQDKVKVFRLRDADKICQLILEDFSQTSQSLYGLILSGGKSQRMGRDKGELMYHNKIQREYEADLLAQFCNRTFISCRKNQDELIESAYEKLYDTFEGLGPFGGILSAFRAFPNTAWLTLACDLPLLNKQALKQLVSRRNPTKLATCFHNPDTSFPEPLITIWEPQAYPILLEFLSQGYSCPRKVLINSDIEEIEIDHTEWLLNVNDPETYSKVKNDLA